MNGGLMQQMDPHFREYPIRNNHLVEIVTDGTNRRLPFPDNNLLQDKHIIGVQVLRKLTNSKSPTGRTLASDVIIDGAYLTIRSGQKDTLRDFPLSLLSKKADGAEGCGNYVQLSIPGGYVPNSSYVQIADGVTLTTNEAILLNFIYIHPDDSNCVNPL